MQVVVETETLYMQKAWRLVQWHIGMYVQAYNCQKEFVAC